MVTNFIALHRRDHSIKERYAIDPCISVPSSLLPPLEEGETEADRKNLQLKTNDGSIDADIWVLGDGGGEFETEEGIMKQKRATLDICSNDGSITVRIVSVLQDLCSYAHMHNQSTPSLKCPNGTHSISTYTRNTAMSRSTSRARFTDRWESLSKTVLFNFLTSCGPWSPC